MKNLRTNQSGRSLNSLLYHTSLLALMMTCFTFYASHSFAQGATGANRVKNVIEKINMMPTGICPDDSVLTNTYCDTGCKSVSGNCTTGGTPSSQGVFMCISTDLSGLGSIPGKCSGTDTSCNAQNCQFIHIRNETGCGDRIDKITIRIFKDASSSSFVICDPVTNFGTNQGGCDKSKLWTITKLTSQVITPDSCYKWADAGGSGTDLVFTPPANTSTVTYDVMPCYHWTVVICGSNNIGLIQLHWVTPGGSTGTTLFWNPTVNTTKCPDASSNQGWAGCP